MAKKVLNELSEYLVYKFCELSKYKTQSRNVLANPKLSQIAVGCLSMIIKNAGMAVRHYYIDCTIKSFIMKLKNISFNLIKKHTIKEKELTVSHMCTLLENYIMLVLILNLKEKDFGTLHERAEKICERMMRHSNSIHYGVITLSLIKSDDISKSNPEVLNIFNELIIKTNIKSLMPSGFLSKFILNRYRKVIHQTVVAILKKPRKYWS